MLNNLKLRNNQMKMNILKVATLASALMLGNTYASDIFIDLDDAGATPTTAIETLNVVYDSHTTINMAEFGMFGTGTVTTVGGVNAIGEDFGFLADPIFIDADDLVGCNGFGCGSTNTLISDPNSLASVFGGSEYATSGMALTFGIDLSGSFDGLNLNYTGGVLDLYSYDPSDANGSLTQVFTSNFVSGSVLAGEQRVNTLIADSSEILVDDTFFFDIGGMLVSFEDYLASNPFNEIRVAIQQFVNTTQLATDIGIALGDSANNDGAGTVHVTALHNASVSFDVPEPTSIAILGLGLLGLAGVRRRKS